MANYVDPYAVLDSIVAKLKTVTGLVTQMGGSASAITAYKDNFPGATNLSEAIYKQATPSMLVYYRRADPSRGMKTVLEHSFGIAVKSGSGGFGPVWAAFANGVPTGQSAKMFFAILHAGLSPMGTAAPSRTPILIDPQTNTFIEYFDISFSLAE